MAAIKVIDANRDIQAALKAINKVEPQLIKQMQKDMRKAAAPTIKSIKDYALWLDPDLTPFNNSGETNIERGELIKGRSGSTRWRKDLILRGIRVKFGGGTRKSRMGRKQYAIMSIIQANPAGAIYDTAGAKNDSGSFIQNLDNQDKPHKDGERKGKRGASRYMWPGGESALPMLRQQATLIMDDVIRKFNRRK